ncbi:MAG: hypothetical protein ACE5R4_15635 [Armatimonadota bacterium]
MGRLGGKCRFARLGIKADADFLRRMPVSLFRARRVMPVVSLSRGLTLVYPDCRSDPVTELPPAIDRGEVEDL